MINQKNINIGLLSFLLLSFLIRSMNGILRWDLNQHIGMVDNFFLYGSFYPTESNLYSPVSIYPFGLRIIALIFSEMGIDELLAPSMLVFSVASLFITIILFLKNNRNDRYLDDARIPLIISYTLICCDFFLFYATEFKPDTLAYLICFMGLTLYNKKNNFLIISSIIIGLSVFIKQQSIAFIIGLILYGIFNYKNRTKYLIFLSATLYFLFFYLYYKNEIIRFYSIEVISDDGFRKLMDVLKELYENFINIGVFLIFLFFTCKTLPNKINIKQIIVKQTQNIYFFLCISIFGLAYFSSLKVGGNSGNIQLGLFYLIPLLMVAIKDFKICYKRAVLVCAISFFMTIGSLIAPIKSVFEYSHLKKAINTITLNSNINKILIDSNTYSIVRHLRNNIIIHDYYTPTLINNDFKISEVELNNYDLIIIHKTTNLEIYKEYFNIKTETDNFIMYNKNNN